MLIIISTADLYIIGHFPRQDGTAGWICFFRKDFLPASTRRHISRLPVFTPGAGGSLYFLDERQNQDVGSIFRKIKEEKGSGYIFSDDLQRTYLVELVHFITRLHQQHFPSILASSN
ncbi:hypothetical protein [Chitinophaga japonensis]|uniref:Uncharacterized protein n=1 Tax=Chitinophaga japonensis TaxID=104662 RepID=A0A562SPA6_CHIJA|nr:hypothetical protein [Chitinophaga japonensis]TWI82520.1 hypothetical protein LX66_5094 [Chitinophaga japonensis]